MKEFRRLQVVPGEPARLSRRDPASDAGFEDKGEALKSFEKERQAIAERQFALYAEGRQALLVVLQGMDTSGKDGAIRHVFSGVNPQGCQVTSFKAPSEEELAHDYLWRIHKAVPAKGCIGVFNRSHYEDVVAVRVHSLAPEKVWKARYDQINVFEKYLSDNGVRILKFFLHLSREEQGHRLEQRRRDPRKRWKDNPIDRKNRKLWKEYQSAYEEALTRCSKPWARWHVVPADRKWVRNAVIARTVARTLGEMDPQFPS